MSSEDSKEWMQPLPATLEVDGDMWNDLRWDGIDLMIANTQKHKTCAEKKAKGEALDYEAMHNSLLNETMTDLLEFKQKLLDIEQSIIRIKKQKKEEEGDKIKTQI